MERWSGILKVPLFPGSRGHYKVAASLCISTSSRNPTVPSMNAIFFNGDRVRGTGNPVIERLSDLESVAKIIVSKLGDNVNAWVIEASKFNGPFAVYKDFIPSVNQWGEPKSYDSTGYPASTSIVSLLSNCLNEIQRKKQMAGKGNPHNKQAREKVVVVVASSSSSHNHRKSHHRDSQKTTPNNTTTATTTTTTTTPQHQKPSPSNPTPQSNNPKPSPSSKPKPPSIPNPNPNSLPENFPPPPTYGFHMLDRRTILLADGTARTYLALPPDYQDFPPRPPIRPLGPETWPGSGLFDRQFRQVNQDHWNSVGLDGSRKRKFGGGDENEMMGDEFARQRQQLLQYGNMGMGLNASSNVAGSSSSRDEMLMRGGKHMAGGNEIDQGKLKTAFLNFVRVVNENANQKKKYLADGKQGPLQCLACGRSSKDFPDMHSLIMHTYNPEKATSDQVPDHLGLHKALCILMGWNYLMPPDNSRAYQRLSAEEAAADRDDLIMWPPHVIIHNTATGKGRDGRMEGLGNKAMDAKLIGLGFTTGKSKAMYGREGHLGITTVKFAGDQSGLRDAMKLADFFQKQKRGRGSWASVQSMIRPGKDDEKDPNFVKLDKKTGEKERILYGYLGTVFDLDTVDFDTRKKVTIESRRERGQPI